MTVLPFDPLPGSDQSGSLAEALQANFDALKTPASRSSLAGSIGGGGTITAGRAFGITQNAVGDYTVTFHDPFGQTPAIVVTPFFGGGTVAHRVSEKDSQHFRVLIYQLSGANVNSNFDFIAETPT